MKEIQPNKKTTKETLNNKIWIAGGIIALVVIVVSVLALTEWEKGVKSNIPTVKVNTPYIDLLIPTAVAEHITNDEFTYGDAYTRAFYLKYGDNELPLWRIDFGDYYAGTWIGMLNTDKGDISVCMTGFVLSDEEMAELGEEGCVLYSKCMDAYSVMLNGIMADPRFTTERPLAVGEDTKVKMTYWDVTLPSTMDVSECNKAGIYEAVFFGEVVGEHVSLYRISIGEEKTEVPLGYFILDDTPKAVYIQAYKLDEREHWSEDDYAAAYRMMDTINDVIEAIMQSKQFSTEAE